MSENRQFDTQNYVVCLKNVPATMQKQDIEDICGRYGQVDHVNNNKAPFVFVKVGGETDLENILKGLRRNEYGIVAEMARCSAQPRQGGGGRQSDRPNPGNNRSQNERPNRPNQQREMNGAPNPRDASRAGGRSENRSHNEMNSNSNHVDRSNIPKGNCKLCNNISTTVCQRCGEFYCSATCQSSDWNKHKYVCIPMPKLVTSNSSQIGVVPEIQLDLPNLNEAKPKPEPKTHNNYNNENNRSNEHSRGYENNRNTETNRSSENSRGYDNNRSNENNRSYENNRNNENHRSNENYRSNDNNRRFQKTNEASPEKPQYRPKDNSTPPKRQNVSFNKGVNEKENIKPAEVKQKHDNDGMAQDKKQNSAHIKNEESNQCPLKNGTVVAITALEKTNCAYIRSLEEKANGLYMNVINQFMGVGESATKLNKLPKVNDMVITDFMQTGFYRAKVTKVENEDKIEVTYIDFGNKELKKLNELKEVPDDFKSLGTYIYAVPLANVPEFPINQKLTEFINTYVDNQTELKLIQKNAAGKNEYELSEVANNSSLNEKISKFQETTVKPVTKPTSVVTTKDIKVKLLPEGKNISVLVSDNSLAETNLISCVAEGHIGDLDTFQNEFNSYAAKVTGPYTPRMSEVCLALFEEDQTWYRAECVEMDDDEHASVIFIDFGNIASVNVKNIRKYPTELIRPCYTNSCVVSGLPDELSEKAANRLRELVPANQIITLDKVKSVEEDQTNIIFLKKLVDAMKAENLI